MSKVSVIIPVHNLFNRGLKRIYNSVLSLNTQRDFIDKIVIVNSSEKRQFEMVNELIGELDVVHLHHPQHEFNKPLLLNIGIKEASSKYIMCTDADYLFKSDFLECCEKHRGVDIMIHKQVYMLPNISNINIDSIDKWKFPKCKLNVWGKLANGACQYSTREFFLENMYNEEMDGFSAMDNLMTYVAFNNGFKIVWMEESEILHQKHPIANKMAGSNRAKFDRNQKILQNYIEENNLPCLLKR